MADFKDIKKVSEKNTEELAELAPEVMESFGQMAEKHAEGEGLDNVTKELLALAFSIALHCEPCIAAHTQNYIDAGGSRQQLKELAEVAVIMHGGPGTVYAAKVIEAYDQLAN